MLRVPTPGRPRKEFLLLSIHQQDRHVGQMEIVARNGQDLLQDLVEVERRQDGLAGVIEDGDFLHAARRFYRRFWRLPSNRGNWWKKEGDLQPSALARTHL